MPEHSLEDLMDEAREEVVDTLHNFKEFILNQEIRDEAYMLEVDGIRHPMGIEGQTLHEMISQEEIYADKVMDILISRFDEYITSLTSEQINEVYDEEVG